MAVIVLMSICTLLNIGQLVFFTLYLCLEYSLGQSLARRFRARSLYTKGAIKCLVGVYEQIQYAVCTNGVIRSKIDGPTMCPLSLSNRVNLSSGVKYANNSLVAYRVNIITHLAMTYLIMLIALSKRPVCIK